MLLLHTVGAKTGRPRTNSLAYYRDGADYLVVASNGGGSAQPGLVSQSARAPAMSRSTWATSGFASTRTPVLPDDPDYPGCGGSCDDDNAGRYGAYQS